jgi:hypothetical protein
MDRAIDDATYSLAYEPVERIRKSALFGLIDSLTAHHGAKHLGGQQFFR